MSQWTHVAGAVRIDCWNFEPGWEKKQKKEKERIEKMFGIPCKFSTVQGESDEELIERWGKEYRLCNVPCGEEGSVLWEFTRTGSSSDISRGIVSIWGDLRDYDNEDEIIKWFKSVIKKFSAGHNKYGFDIRDAVLSIEVEFKNTKTVLVCTGDDDVAMRFIPQNVGSIGLTE